MMLNSPPFHELPATRARAGKAASIGSILLEQGRMTKENVEQVLRLQKTQNIRFGTAAQSLGLLTETDVEQALAQQFDFTCLAPGEGDFALELVAAYAPVGAAAEALRGIRSQLIVQGVGAQRKTVAVVGVDNEAGNSLLAANLAVMFAQLNKKTVLVDANLCSSRQQTIFNTGHGPGLADVLADRADLDALVTFTQLPHLSLLPAGTPAPNPADLLGRGAFRELHAALAQEFDLILIDSCGFSAQGEALPLAPQIEAAILTTCTGQTRMRELTHAAARLKQAGVDIAGTVLLGQ